MKHQRSNTSVTDALAYLDSLIAARTPQSEQIAVVDADDRVMAETVFSDVAIPSFRRSMMDGFALCSADMAEQTGPVILDIVGQSFPGREWKGVLQAGQAIRIMTGAPVPDHADVVVPIELVTVQGGTVHVSQPVVSGKNVARVGEDLDQGDEVAAAGRRLRPQDIGLLASIGCSQVSVVRRPRVGLIITGNELLPAGTRPTGHRIADSNGPMLAALVKRDGGIVVRSGLTPDTPSAIREALSDGLQDRADLLLVSGGSSAGDEDFAPDIIHELGELPIHGIAMRPGAPAGLGRAGQCPVVLLPGNPVACLFAYDLFAGRAVRALSGRQSPWPYASVCAALESALESSAGRTDYARIRLVEDRARLIAVSGSSLLSSTTKADGFLLIPAAVERLSAGTSVQVWLYGN